MHSEPLSTSSLAYSGKGGCVSDGIKKRREGSPLSNLDLQVGSSAGLSGEIKREKEELVFTAAQFGELYLQVAIFNYIISGLPVPLHLVLPIWNGAASSLGFAKAGICEEFPGLVGFIPYGSMMDTEPWRCRRTDGKKWRCYRNVVPDQKYCERHMHRGCQRSRKHVEATQVIQKSSKMAFNSDNSRSSIISSSNAVADSRISACISTSLDLRVPSSSVSKKGMVTVEGCSASVNRNSENDGNNIIEVNGASSSSLRDLTSKKNSRHDSNCTFGKDFTFNLFHTSKIDWCNQGNKSYCDASVVPGFGLSPSSVLQSGFGGGHSRLSCENKSVMGMETQSLRCRRTDGKKWRCSRDVVRDKKYCEKHLHRGAKKAMVDSKLVTGAPVCFSTRMVGVANSIHKKVENCVNLNTNLSISIASSPPNQLPDSDSSSSSDATTVTDENVCASHLLTLSP